MFLHVLVQSSYILDVVGTFWMLGLSRAFDFVWLCHLCDLLTITVRDKPACDSDVNGKAGMEKPSRRWRGAVQQLADFEKVSFRATTPAPVIVRATFSWPIYLVFFLFSSSGNCLKNIATDFFYSFPMISGDETKSGYVEKHLFLYISKYFRRLTFELWNSVATFCT